MTLDNVDLLRPTQDYKRIHFYTEKPSSWMFEILARLDMVNYGRLKTRISTATGEGGRAKGYVKGAEKVDSEMETFKRETYPTTIYTKQRVDRDDIIDLESEQAVEDIYMSMIKTLHLDLARSILVADNRPEEEYRIANPTGDGSGIRAIAQDVEPYIIPLNILFPDVLGASHLASIIRMIMSKRKEYQGGSRPLAFIAPDLHDKIMTIQTQNGKFAVNNNDDLADRLGVAKIIPVPMLNGYQTSKVSDPVQIPAIIIFDPVSYTLGMDSGGGTRRKSKVDIDSNQNAYLVESRLSGALTVPKSAIVVYQGADDRIEVPAKNPVQSTTDGDKVIFDQNEGVDPIVRWMDAETGLELAKGTCEKDIFDTRTSVKIRAEIMPDYQATRKLPPNLEGKVIFLRERRQIINIKVPFDEKGAAVLHVFGDRNEVEWFSNDSSLGRGSTKIGLEKPRPDVLPNITAKIVDSEKNNYVLSPAYRNRRWTVSDTRTEVTWPENPVITGDERQIYVHIKTTENRVGTEPYKIDWTGYINFDLEAEHTFVGTGPLDQEVPPYWTEYGFEIGYTAYYATINPVYEATHKLPYNLQNTWWAE